MKKLLPAGSLTHNTLNKAALILAESDSSSLFSFVSMFMKHKAVIMKKKDKETQVLFDGILKDMIKKDSQ